MRRPEAGQALRLAVWLAVLALALYLVFVGGGWQGVYTVVIRQASVVLAGAALLAWLVGGVVRPSWRPRSVLLAPIGLCLAAVAVSTATSRFPWVSVEYLGYAVLLSGLYVLLVALLREPFLRLRFAALTVSLCVGVGVLFVALNVRHWLDWWALVGRVTVPPLRPDFESLTFGNPSAVLTLTVLLLAPAVAHVGLDSVGRRAVVVALGGLVAAVAILSGSRAGWLAMALAVALVGGAWLVTGGGRATVRRVGWAVRTSPVARIAVLVAGLVGIGAVAVLAPALLRRLTEGGEELRLGFVVAALRMFAEAPVVGTGPGTWVIQRVRFTVAPETDYYIPHAHDLYAQTLAELGLLGALAGIVLVGGVVWLIGGAVRDPDATRRRWGWAAAFSLVYFGAHQLFVVYLNLPALLFAAALPIAWLEATAPSGTTVAGRALSGSLPRGAVVALAALVLVATVGLEAAELPAASHARAVDLANGGAWTTAHSPAATAVAMAPEWPPYQLTLGLTAARVGDHARAAAAFRQAALTDDLPEAWLDLAAEEAALGDEASARDALAAALRLGYQRPSVAVPAGELALRLGDETTARAAFTAALAAAPSLAGDPWWTADPARAALFPAVRDAAIAGAGPAAGWEIAMVSGDPDRARQLAAGLDPTAASLAEHVITAWNGDTAARQAVLDGCAARPLELVGLWWCARLEARAGDDAAANRYRTWANIILGGSYAAGAELRVRTGEAGEQVGRSDAGSPALFYGHYTYRRPTPWDLLVPSLVHLTLE